MRSHQPSLAPRGRRARAQENVIDEKHVLLCLFAGFLSLLPSLAFPGDFVAFGPEDYIRAGGSPLTIIKTFSVLNSNTAFTLQIYNGGLIDAEFEKVSNSIVSLNGVQVVGPNEFNQNVRFIERPITLSRNNQLSVELRGKPGGGITLQLIGVDDDPPTINAQVNPSANAFGWHKGKPTVSFTCADSISGVASCPGAIVVDAEAANQVVSGTAADLAGNNATASVTLNIDKTPPAVTIFSPANGATISTSRVTVTGSVVESLSGIAEVACNGAPAIVSGSLFACEVELVAGSNDIKIGATDVAGNASSSTISANLVSTPSVVITSPAMGTVLNEFSVLVTGEFDDSLGEVGINVNGYVALQNGNEFAALVPVDATTISLTATVASASGSVLASHQIPVTVQAPGTEQVLSFRPFPVSALVSEPVTFTLTSINEIVQIELDGNGDGTIDFTGTSLQGVSVSFAEPGIYYPTVTVTDTNSAVFTGSAIVQIVDIAQLDLQLRTKWDAMKAALRSGNTSLAASYIVADKRADYEIVFNNLTIPFASIDQILGSLTYQELKGFDIEYEMLMNDGPDGDVSYLVTFSVDEDGVWRVSFF